MVMIPKDTVTVTTYVSDSTKKHWVEHLKKVKPRYASVSHFLEEAAEYKISADNDFLNKSIEGWGIPAVGPLRRRNKK